MTFSPYALLCRSASCPERYLSVLFSTSKRVCMLFWSSSASSCSFSHMVACSSASSASSFSSSVRLWLFMNPAMLSTVCCCLFIFLFSPFCLSSASCDYIAYHFSYSFAAGILPSDSLTGISIRQHCHCQKTAVPLSVIRTC